MKLPHTGIGCLISAEDATYLARMPHLAEGRHVWGDATPYGRTLNRRPGSPTHGKQLAVISGWSRQAE